MPGFPTKSSNKYFTKKSHFPLVLALVHTLLINTPRESCRHPRLVRGDGVFIPPRNLTKELQKVINNERKLKPGPASFFVAGRGGIIQPGKHLWPAEAHFGHVFRSRFRLQKTGPKAQILVPQETRIFGVRLSSSEHRNKGPG